MLIKITQDEKAQLEGLITAFNTARGNLEDFLEDLKTSFEESFADEPESYAETTDGEEAQSRISLIESWIDEVCNDFDPDLSEIS